MRRVVSCILLFWLPFCAAMNVPRQTVVEQTVIPGKNAILQCASNDRYHVFMYWYFNKNNVVIGPSNDFNRVKYEYEVLTGNLTVKATTPYEAGVYNCVSQGVDKQDISISSVKMIVIVNENEETDSAKFVIACAVLGVIFVILCGVYGAFLMYNKRRCDNIAYVTPHEEDEDSNDELFTRGPSTSQNKSKDEANGKIDDFTKVKGNFYYAADP